MKENPFEVIPGIYGNLTLTHKPSKSPLYWRLHDVFYGDRLLSYGGKIRFTTESIDGNHHSQNEFTKHALVIIRGNKLQIEYVHPIHSVSNHHEVKMHELFWRRDKHKISRKELMIILQNITDIFIKASDSDRYTKLM